MSNFGHTFSLIVSIRTRPYKPGTDRGNYGYELNTDRAKQWALILTNRANQWAQILTKCANLARPCKPGTTQT